MTLLPASWAGFAQHGAARRLLSQLRLKKGGAPMVNDLQPYRNFFDSITPWKGEVAECFYADFVGVQFDARFHVDMPGSLGRFPDMPPKRHVETSRPTIKNGESFFETVDIILALREAKERFTMIELGGGWGPRCVLANALMKQVRPMPAKFVVVEPEPLLVRNARQHFLNNGMDPEEHWFPNVAVSANGKPALFLTGKGRMTSARLREHDIASFVNLVERHNLCKPALLHMLNQMSLGLAIPAAAGSGGATQDVTAIGTVALRDLLDPFERVDLMDIDIQSEEAEVLPPNMKVLTKKAKRLHIGTHGRNVHELLERSFRDAGWEIVFSYPGDKSHYDTELGSFDLADDGILTVVNPFLT